MPSHWGVKSYEHDLAALALDAAFESVNGAEYERLMDDRCPLDFEQVQAKLADPATLAHALETLAHERSADPSAWDDEARLAYAGIVIRHAECRVLLPPAVRERALEFLREESIEWDEARARRLRREKEIRLLSSTS
jgi:hypothetical protein